jgi:1A family penicillin-binding protein
LRGKGRFSLWRFFWRFCLSVSLLLILWVGFLFVWYAKDLPDPGKLTERQVKQSTKIYDRTGTTILYEIGEIKRTWVPLNELPDHIKQATIVAEDDDFYKHHGLDFKGILRAAFKDVTGQSLQGGSTITQQLIKNSILTPERTLRRKIKEAILAIELEQKFTKDQILEMYLNEIPYGGNAYGVEAAARMFFGISARDLSLPQAALLASLPRAPTYYSPYGSHIEELHARKDSILARMVREGYITAAQAEQAKAAPLVIQPRRDRIVAPHFVFFVQEQLVKKYGENIVKQGGLQVKTSLDLRIQRAAEEALATHAEMLKKKYEARNAALVALDPRNGDILAMVGSLDYFDTANDGNVNVAVRPRSPGSSIKPFVYAAALIKGYTPDTILWDVETEFAAGGKSYRPKNYDLTTRGPMTMRQALAGSVNIPAVKTLYLVGVREAVQLAQKFGMRTLNKPERYGLSLVLGGGEVRLLDEVSAYAALANNGRRYEPRSILEVKDASGRKLFAAEEEQAEGEQIIEEKIAHTITSILSDNNARAFVFGSRNYLTLPNRPVAAKTGTTQEYRDAWTLGYTPSLVAGVWVGNNDNSPMKGAAAGANTAAPIWNTFMKKVLQGTPVEKFPSPPSNDATKLVLRGKLPEIKARYDPETDQAFPLDCPVDLPQIFTIKEAHSILFYTDRNNPRGNPPPNPERDPQFSAWEGGIKKWVQKWNEEKAKEKKIRYVNQLPELACDPDYLEGRPEVDIVSPQETILRRVRKLTLRAEINSPSPVKKVTFLVNNKVVGEKGEPPWEWTIELPPTYRGKMVLTVRVKNEEDKLGLRHRTIIINPDSSTPKVRLLDPRAAQTIPRSEFPYRIKIFAEDPSGIEFVDVLYRKINTTRTSRIDRIRTPLPGRPTRYETDWGIPPEPGKYRLWATAQDKTGNSASTEPITITVY